MMMCGGVPQLKMLRYAKGYTQEALADAAGISRDTYQNIESGRSDPRASTLQNIARVLGVEVQDLFGQAEIPARVRFRSSRRMNSRDMILCDAVTWMRDYSRLEGTLNNHASWLLGDLSTEMTAYEGGPEKAKLCAVRARQQLGLSAGEPVRDVCGLLESAGVKVYPKEVMSEGFFGLSIGPIDGGPLIVVNVWGRISVERWIFTAAHEFGHLLLHPDSYDVSVAREDLTEEQEANIFASYFLMPGPVFDTEWRNARGLPFVDRVLKVKRMFRVSYKTVLYRLSETHRLDDNLWGKFQGEYRRRYGKTLKMADEPQPASADDFMASYPEAYRAVEPCELSEADFVPDRLARLVRQALEGGHISLSRAAGIIRIDAESMRNMALSWVNG
ncbi:MAG: helix-turn-helix domain-containing protein [Clostridia bacterium]|nr:helix-turn-helix domain-containing protein [Clostridia bacterium]